MEKLQDTGPDTVKRRTINLGALCRRDNRVATNAFHSLKSRLRLKYCPTVPIRSSRRYKADLGHVCASVQLRRPCWHGDVPVRSPAIYINLARIGDGGGIYNGPHACFFRITRIKRGRVPQNLQYHRVAQFDTCSKKLWLISCQAIKWLRHIMSSSDEIGGFYDLSHMGEGSCFPAY